MPHRFRACSHLGALLAFAIVGYLSGCQDDPPDEPFAEVPCNLPPQTDLQAINDTGTPCEPWGETEPACNFQCTQLSDSAVCTDLCDDTACPEGYRCNDLPWGDNVCLPNLVCGDLTYEGICEGTVVTYCGYEAVETYDCNEQFGADGTPLVCGWVDGVGSDCVSSSYDEGCGDVTYDGYCDDQGILHYCLSTDTGELGEVDCAADGLVCLVDEYGSANCLPEGGGDCGAVTYLGYCDGDVAVWCENYTLTDVDCSAQGLPCGYIDDSIGFYCVEAGGEADEPTATPMTVTATYNFEKPALTQSGLGSTTPTPIRQALVTVMRTSDDTEVARGFTDDDGAISIALDTTESCYLLLRAVGNGTTYPFSVRDCPLDDCTPKLGNVYGHQSEAFSVGDTGVVLAPVVLTVASGLAGAFNIFDLLVTGSAFATANLGSSPGQHIVQWKAGSDTTCKTSCYWKQTLYIMSTDADTDEFDDPVVLHEYGHFLEDTYSRRDSPGGSHDGSPTNPLLAWGEGYGTYAGCAIADSSLYIDTMADETSVVDINADGFAEYPADPNHPKGMRQLVSEYLVAEILWKLSRGYKHQGVQHGGKTDAPIFDVLRAYFVSPEMADRGVKGLDLVDFLDGWFWRGHGDPDFIEALVVDLAEFPYDFGGPTYCEEAPAPADSALN